MKPLFVISCPIDTYSGYGARSRDLVRAIIELDKYELKVLPQRWGNTRWGFIENHSEWHFLKSYILPATNQLDRKPKIWAQVTIPSEFQALGDFNIGFTAGIETTVPHYSWIQGLNKMNVNFVSSEFSKQTLKSVSFAQKDQAGNEIGSLQLQSPIEVLFEGADLTKYFPSKETNNFNLEDIKESFAYLFVGHWLPGDFGKDRKNVGLLIKSFLETFKDQPKSPALILKTSIGSTSYMDRDLVLQKIDYIRKSVTYTKSLPNIYLIHGDLTDKEMNDLYNHKKVKAMVSLTKGEGFGRPLLEFSLTKKPIIASRWSGHMDFLNPKFTTLLEGQLENVHPSAAVENMILEDGKWFSPDHTVIEYFLKDMFNNYKLYTKKSMLQYHSSKNNFSFDSMVEALETYFDQYIPEFPSAISLKLPELALPKLNKV